eukprot:gene1129-665_t
MYLRNNQLTSDDPKMLIPMPDQPPDPLAPTTVWPNYMLLVSYPLFNSNARILFTKQMNRQGMGTGIILPKKVGLFTNLSVLNQITAKESIFAAYLGLPLYVCHGFAKDKTKALCAKYLCKDDPDFKTDQKMRQKRLALKYASELAAFPILYVATRQIVSNVTFNPLNDLMNTINEAYVYGGLAAFWSGAFPHVMSVMVEDAMSTGLEMTMDKRYPDGLDSNDKFILKMSFSVLISCFTAPFVTLSVSRRVAGGGPSFPDAAPLTHSFGDMSLTGFLFQVALFSALFGVNMSLIDAKQHVENNRR